MSKSKKLTFGMIAADMKPNDNAVCEYEYEGKNGKYGVTIRRWLPLADAMSFIAGIIDVCIDMDAGEYHPETFDFALRLSVLISYAGFDSPDMTDTTAVAKAYDVVYNTDLFERITENIDWVQYHELVESATEQIRYMRDCMVSAKASKINDLLEKMDAVMKSGENLMSELTSRDLKATIDEMLKLSGKAKDNSDNARSGNIVLFPSGDDA